MSAVRRPILGSSDHTIGNDALRKAQLRLGQHLADLAACRTERSVARLAIYLSPELSCSNSAVHNIAAGMQP